MAGLGSTRKVTSLPPPLQKDPPAYPDLYGKRRELNRVQLLESEIRFLEEEIKFAEGLHPASRPCTEVADFATSNPDPFVPMTKAHKSSRFWKWLCGTPCMKHSRPCCIGCTPPNHHHHDSRNYCCSCDGCGSKSSYIINCSQRENSSSCCCEMPSCSSISSSCVGCECHHPFPNCGVFKGCVAIYSKCLKLDLCYCCCKRYSCYHCCICC